MILLIIGKPSSCHDIKNKREASGLSKNAMPLTVLCSVTNAWNDKLL